MVSAMLASIQATAKSPEDDSKVQSSRGGKRGKRKGARESSVGSSAKSRKAMDLLNSIDAKKAERQRKERIRELEARQNANQEEEVAYVALPTIMTASEREAAKSKTKRSSIETIDLLTSELGVPEDVVHLHSKSELASDVDDDDWCGGAEVGRLLHASMALTWGLSFCQKDPTSVSSWT